MGRRAAHGAAAGGWLEHYEAQLSPSKTQPSQIHAQKSSELIAFLQQLHTSWIPGLLSSPIEREAGRSLPLVYTKIVHVQIGQPPRFKISGSSAAATESWVILLYSNLGGRWDVSFIPECIAQIWLDPLTLRCQINESTWLAFFDFSPDLLVYLALLVFIFHPTRLVNFPLYLFIWS